MSRHDYHPDFQAIVYATIEAGVLDAIDFMALAADSCATEADVLDYIVECKWSNRNCADEKTREKYGKLQELIDFRSAALRDEKSLNS